MRSVVPADSAASQKLRAILISVIGAKAYDVLLDLCSPIPPSKKTYSQLTTILKNHFAPKKPVIAERYRFYNCTQREGESVTTFAANQKHLASTCQFGTHLKEALRDRFVCGLRSKETQKKLLTEEHTFDAARVPRSPSAPKLPKMMLLRSRKKVQLLLTESTLVMVDVSGYPTS